MDWNSHNWHVMALCFAVIVGATMIVAGLFMLFGWSAVLIAAGVAIIGWAIVQS